MTKKPGLSRNFLQAERKDAIQNDGQAGKDDDNYCPFRIYPGLQFQIALQLTEKVVIPCNYTVSSMHGSYENEDQLIPPSLEADPSSSLSSQANALFLGPSPPPSYSEAAEPYISVLLYSEDYGGKNRASMMTRITIIPLKQACTDNSDSSIQQGKKCIYQVTYCYLPRSMIDLIGRFLLAGQLKRILHMHAKEYLGDLVSYFAAKKEGLSTHATQDAPLEGFAFQ